MGHEFIKAVRESISCTDITEYLNEKGVTFDEMPTDIQNLSIRCDESFSPVDSVNAWDEVKSKVDNAYTKTKLIEQTKNKLEYEFKASEQFWDGQVFEIERASFDLVVDLNLIEQVLFGSQADWVNPDEVFKFPSDEEGEDDEEGADSSASGTGDETPGSEEGDEEDEDFDDSVTAEETIIPGEEVECVPADDPDADLDNDPGDTPNENCGNFVLDVLMGEECDDGNNVSGDGCSQYCMIEDNGGGVITSGDMCMDSEAVTFSSPSDSTGSNTGSDGSDTDNSGEDDDVCPPGTFPKKEVSVEGPSGSGQTGEDGVTQSENYPGPYIGGTLKNYPPSNRPACPTGYSELSVFGSTGTENSSASGSASGSDTLGINVGGAQYDIPYCIPTEFCASFDDMRSAIFGADWKEDEEKSKAAYAIEGLFCVNIKKADRPETGYRPDEGCVDCHLTAIVDSVYEALDTNVTPMANTTGSFAISSAWGPNMSFDLTTAVKQKLRLALPDPKSGPQLVDEEVEKVKAANNIPESSSDGGESDTEKAERELAEIKKQKEALIESMKSYRDSNNSLSDQAIFTRVKPLLIQMLQSFQAMQANYDQLTRNGAADGLASKNQC